MGAHSLPTTNPIEPNQSTGKIGFHPYFLALTAWRTLLPSGAPNINCIRKIPTQVSKTSIRLHYRGCLCLYEYFLVTNNIDPWYCSNLHVFFRLILDSIPCYTLKSSFHIEALFSRRLKIGDIPLRCTPCFSLFLWNLKIKTKLTTIQNKSGWKEWVASSDKKYSLFGYYHHQHRSCSRVQQMGNSLDQMG